MKCFNIYRLLSIKEKKDYPVSSGVPSVEGDYSILQWTVTYAIGLELIKNEFIQRVVSCLVIKDGDSTVWRLSLSTVLPFAY